MIAHKGEDVRARSGDGMSKKMVDVNPGFSAEVVAEPGGEHLNSCFSCGACSGACPVSQAIPDFDPRKIIHMVRMGMEERLLDSDLLWYCSSCRSCVFVCPQDVSFADIMSALAKLALKKGYITAEQLVEKLTMEVLPALMWKHAGPAVFVLPNVLPRPLFSMSPKMSG